MVYPATAKFKQLHALIGGWMNDPYDPEQLLTLETIDIRTMAGGEMPRLSGKSWNDFHRENPETEEDGSPIAVEDYTMLEKAIAAGDDIPPVVLQRRANGELVHVDGWHRITIAMHVGRYKLLAYVAPPEADWDDED